MKVIDTAKLPLGQQYKIVIPATVKSDAAADKDIVNVARQLVVNSSGKQLAIKTETRVNKLSVPKATPKQKETPIQKVADTVLPKTGEGKAALSISLFGAALLGIAAFLKRRSIVAAYRKVVRKILK
nr:LPXTG cell wall anchor domain-containing protein [Lactococcus taiwanensis]